MASVRRGTGTYTRPRAPKGLPFSPPRFLNQIDHYARGEVWLDLERDGVRLACRDFGGTGPPVLLLHGLAGHTGEWEQTAARLVARYRVLGLDQRGHGRSERHPPDVSRAASVADVARVIDDLGLAPVVLVGQSMGGNTAFLTAAANADLVAALIVIEASPDGPSPDLADHVRGWLDRWPIPFPTVAAARGFFASEGLAPDPWVGGLEHREDGLWPCFEPAVMVACIADLAARDYWKQWDAIRCPTLIVRGDHGQLSARQVEALAHRVPQAESVTVPDAGHDVHLDAPTECSSAVERFLIRHLNRLR